MEGGEGRPAICPHNRGDGCGGGSTLDSKQDNFSSISAGLVAPRSALDTECANRHDQATLDDTVILLLIQINAFVYSLRANLDVMLILRDNSVKLFTSNKSFNVFK